MDIKKLDRYMARSKIDLTDLEFFDPRTGNFSVEGLYWFDSEKRYQRLPQSAANSVPPAIWTLSECPTGAQIRFQTDSCRIVVSGRRLDTVINPLMAETGRSGFDLYCGELGAEEFWNVVQPTANEQEFADQPFNVQEKKMRHFRLNFPLYSNIDEFFIGVEKGSSILPPAPLKSSRPIVIYGTSITQGGCASRPGSLFTNILSRKLQMEFLNFGFSGNGSNHLEVAKVLADIKNPGMFILDSEANSISAELIRERVPVFLDIIRQGYGQDVPIVVLSKVTYGQRYALELPVLKDEFRAIVEARQNSGDDNIFFVDGSSFFDTADYSENTIDGAHPTDRGFFQMAQKLEPVLKEIINRK